MVCTFFGTFINVSTELDVHTAKSWGALATHTHTHTNMHKHMLIWVDCHVVPRDKQTNKQRNKQTNKQANKETSKQRNKETKKQRNKQTNKQTNKQRNKETKKQTNKQTSKQTSKQTNKQTRKFVGTARMSWRKAGRVFSFSSKCFQTHFSCYTELHPQQWSLLGGPSWCAAIPAIAKPTKCWCLCCLNFNYLTYPPTMTCVKPIESLFPCICSNLCSLTVHGVALVDVTEGCIYIYIQYHSIKPVRGPKHCGG